MTRIQYSTIAEECSKGKKRARKKSYVMIKWYGNVGQAAVSLLKKQSHTKMNWDQAAVSLLK